MTMVTNTSPVAGAKPNRQQRRHAARLAKKGRRGNGAAAPADATLQEAVKLHKAGHPHEALQLYRKILAVRPDQFDALNLGGVANCELGHIGEAVKLLQAAVRLEPSYAEAHNNLGNALKAADRLDEAAAAYRRAIGIKPDYAEPHYNLGILLQKSRNISAATATYRRATEINPNFAEAHNSLGAMLQEFGELGEAIAAYRRAIEIRPDYTTAHSNLGAALLRGGHSDEALAHCHHALRLDPNDVSVHNNLGMILKDIGRLDEAIEAYRNALTLKPSFSKAHSNLIFTMNFHSRFTAESILAESRHWDEIHALPHAIRARPHANSPDPERRLRIGYVSPDFRCHSVSYFIESLLAAHDRNAVEVFCYAEVARPDAVTTRLRALADGWRWTFGTSDEALAEHIREDGIDILIDLAGHTSSNRLLTFAQRPAPVQATWLGYPNTTGLTAMDYRLTDAIVDPEGTADAVHSEKLVRLAKSFLCYVPPADAPKIADLPAAANGYITFGSFNNLAKVTPDVVEVWATILRHTPGSRILLKSRLFAHQEMRKRYEEMFVAHGVDIECVELVPDIPSVSGHLAAYAGVDIGLDPFPYNGTTTTCEALWMGVPMIALRGHRHAARVGLGLLTSMGMPELAAETQEAYIKTAVDLAGDLDRLLALRGSLRARMRNSPLCDAKAFARDMEAAYRDMWRRWCAKTATEESLAFDSSAAIQRSEFNSRSVPKTATKPKIRVLHHMARTGGTVISKCLASMDNIMLLSEIHPQGTKHFNPLKQALEWFGLFSSEEIEQLEKDRVGFNETVELIRDRAHETKRDLVIRDWSHLDFTAVPFLADRSYRLTTANVLKADFDVIHTATVRHPIDQWLSLRRLAAVAGKLNLDEFLRDCRRFAETVRNIGFVRYEDFTHNPDAALQDLCQRLDLSFDPAYRQRWKAYQNITGDVEPNVPINDIAPRKRGPMEPDLLERLEENKDYWAVLDILGYAHG